jgi:hypothetical protein
MKSDLDGFLYDPVHESSRLIQDGNTAEIDVVVLSVERSIYIQVTRTGQSVWDLWWTKWHWDRFFSEFFGFPLSVSFHRRSPNSYHLGDA